MSEKRISIGTGPIVCVDDSSVDAFIVRKCLERSKLMREFTWLSSGDALIEHLEAVIEGREAMPALVLLDINMPGVDGLSTLRRVRSQASFRQIPIIMMLTNSSDPQDREQSLSLGADGFYTKAAKMEDYVAFFDSIVDDESVPG